MTATKIGIPFPLALVVPARAAAQAVPAGQPGPAGLTRLPVANCARKGYKTGCREYKEFDRLRTVVRAATHNHYRTSPPARHRAHIVDNSSGYRTKFL